LSTYLDTSALLAYYLPEPRSEAFDAIIRTTASPAISNLVECEMVALVGQKVRGGTYNRRDAGRALGRFREDIGRGAYRYLVVDEGLIHAAMTLMEGFKVALRTLDALHTAAVIQYGCDLLTGDERMARSARGLGITTTYIPNRAAPNRGESVLEALVNTLGLGEDVRSDDLERLRGPDPEHGELWYHVPSGAVVRVTAEEGLFHGKLLN